MILVTDSDIGKWVLYNPGYGLSEKGRIKGFNEQYVFVVYKCDNDWDNYQDYTGCATKPEHLTFLEKGETNG